MAINFCDDCDEQHDGALCDEHCALCCFAHHGEHPSRERIIALYNHIVLGYDWDREEPILCFI